ncbi:hypothetical protein [Denitratimonas sp. CY0512]
MVNPPFNVDGVDTKKVKRQDMPNDADNKEPVSKKQTGNNDGY